MKRKYQKREFNDEGLDELYRSEPDRPFSLSEMAKAAKVERQTIWAIEQRAIKKMRDEFMKRGIDVYNADAIDFSVEGFGVGI